MDTVFVENKLVDWGICVLLFTITLPITLTIALFALIYQLLSKIK